MSGTGLQIQDYWLILANRKFLPESDDVHFMR
jgi:hypothetical protein